MYTALFMFKQLVKVCSDIFYAHMLGGRRD